MNDWNKAGKSRTYVEVAVYTNAWSRKRTEKSVNEDPQFRIWRY